MAIYECEKCRSALSPGLWACPLCGDPFSEQVPAEAESTPPNLVAAADPDDAALPEYVLPPSRHGAPSLPDDSAYLYLQSLVSPPPPYISQTPQSQQRLRTSRALGVAIPIIIVLGIVSFLLGMKYRQSHHILVIAFLTQHAVTYRITGTAPIVDVIYQDGMGATEQVNNVPLPWSQTYSVDSGTYLYLSAQTRGKGGHIKTEIDVDGKPRKTAATEGAYTTVYVSDSLP